MHGALLISKYLDFGETTELFSSPYIQETMDRFFLPQVWRDIYSSAHIGERSRHIFLII